MERVIKRSDYDTNSVNNDIALLRLAEVLLIIICIIIIVGVHDIDKILPSPLLKVQLLRQYHSSAFIFTHKLSFYGPGRINLQINWQPPHLTNHVKHN